MEDRQTGTAKNQPPTLQDTLPPGAKLGDYTILRVLGQGGFGITYLAHDSKLDQDVVLWTSFVCRPSITNHPNTNEGIGREKSLHAHIKCVQ